MLGFGHTPPSFTCCAPMTGEETQTPSSVRTPNHASVDRTGAQEEQNSTTFEMVHYEINNASAQSAPPGCSSARQEHSNSGDFLAKNEKGVRDASNAAIDVSTPGTTTAAVITPSDGSRGGGGKLTVAAIEAGRASESYGDLADFVVVAGGKDSHGDNKPTRYDAGIDIPLPRRHPEVARVMAAKSAKGRQRSELDASEVGNETSYLCAPAEGYQICESHLPQAIGSFFAIQAAW